MSNAIRCHLRFPPEVIRTANAQAARHGISRNAAFIRALGLAEAMDEAAREGHTVGMCRDRRKLDHVLITPRVSA